MVLTNRDKALGILGSRKKLFKKVLDMFTHPLVSCCPVMSEPRNTVPQPPLNFYEFFCGGGMARAGLGEGWKCVRANDFDPKKCEVYAANWGRDALIEGDVRKLEPSDLPDIADLAWASFPCQDLSLAGTGAGLKGDRSGTFWPFWKLVNHLCEEHRAPRMIVLENVYGTLTSHAGKDFAAICTALTKAGYRYGALVIDAIAFVPQSRPRLFIVAVAEGIEIPSRFMGDEPGQWHSQAIVAAHKKLPTSARQQWVWWALPAPAKRSGTLTDIIEDPPTGVPWHTQAETRKLLAMMSEANLLKVEEAGRSGIDVVGTVYKRTRRDDVGRKVQRAEVRFDGVAGCLRTPAGGSSRQTVLFLRGKTYRSRLMTIRETARLMGLPESFVLPVRYNEGYHVTGDGVVVPVVRYLAENLLEPVLAAYWATRRAAA